MGFMAMTVMQYVKKSFKINYVTDLGKGAMIL